MFNQLFIESKLKNIEGYVDRLGKLLNQDDERLLQPESNDLFTIERLFQLSVDGMISINQHLIRQLKSEIPDDLQSTFQPLGEKGILPKEFAIKISPIVAVRNMLVHQYEKVDSKLFLKNLRKNLSDFEDYRKHIGQYISKN